MKLIQSKKICLLLIAVMLFSVVLSGCSSDQGGSNPGEDTDTTSSSSYPTKAINLIVPWAAGGGTDVIFRKLADNMSNDLGQPIVILNVEGGGGQVGFQQIAASDADGYTVGVITNSMLLQKITQGTTLGGEDFSVVSMINYDPATLTVNAESPYTTIEDFANAAKEDPSALRIGNSGSMGVWHIASMLMGRNLDIEVTDVPYEGANPAAVAVAGGHIEGVTVSPGEVKGLVDGGKLKILGIMSNDRLSSFPDVPTFQESGYDLSFGVWRALVGPKGLPEEVIERLETSIQKAVESEDFKTFMADNEYGIDFRKSAEATEYIINEESVLQDVISN